MNGRMKLIILGVFVVVLGVGGVVASIVEAKKVGEKCDGYMKDCSGNGAQCLASNSGNYCSIECSADPECPATWKCANITAGTYSGKTGQKVSEKSVKMCVKPN